MRFVPGDAVLLQLHDARFDDARACAETRDFSSPPSRWTSTSASSAATVCASTRWTPGTALRRGPHIATTDKPLSQTTAAAAACSPVHHRRHHHQERHRSARKPRTRKRVYFRIAPAAAIIVGAHGSPLCGNAVRQALRPPRQDHGADEGMNHLFGADLTVREELLSAGSRPASCR